MHTLLRHGALARRLQHLRQKREVQILLSFCPPPSLSLACFPSSSSFARALDVLERATFPEAQTNGPYGPNAPFHSTAHF